MGLVFVSGVVWLTLTALKAGIFRRRPVAWRRRVQPWWQAFLGLYLLGCVAMVTASTTVLLYAAPVVAVGTLLAVKSTRYCDVCGAMCITLNWWASEHYCSRCGARLGVSRVGSSPATAR